MGRLFRDVGNVTMDTAGVERVDVNALGGADLVTVNDLSATDVKAVNVDLAGSLGGAAGDGQPDRVVVNATNGEDAIAVTGDASEVKVSGLAAGSAIFHPEAGDRLEVNTLAGRDSVDSSGLAAGAIQLFVAACVSSRETPLRSDAQGLRPGGPAEAAAGNHASRPTTDQSQGRELS